MTVTKEQALEALKAITYWIGPHSDSETVLRQFIEQSASQGGADIDREELADFYKWKSGKASHTSDCATSVAPAYVPGPCDCSAEDLPPVVAEPNGQDNPVCALSSQGSAAPSDGGQQG